MNNSRTHIPKFLIIRFSSIGDIIQCMGVISGIKNKFPDAEIHWIARQDMASFLSMDKRIHKIWAFDKKEGFKGLWRMAGILQKEHFDYVYDAHSNIRSNILKIKLLLLSARPPFYTLRSKERFKRFLLFKLRINLFSWPFKGVESYRKPLKKWGIRDFSGNYSDWYFPTDFPERLDRYIDSRTITLVPSANWEMKRWPVAYWQKLIHLLPEYKFIILAGPTDTFCETIYQTAPHRVLNLAGQTTLLESCYLVRRSNLVISADTGFLHAADLFKTKAIALIGPTAFGFPSGPTVLTLTAPLKCRPCTKDGHGKCKNSVYQKCMVDLTPCLVAEKATQLFPFAT